CIEPHPALARLALALARRCLLNPVVHRVAYHVLQWIADLLDHRLVELRILAEYLQPDLLTHASRRVTHKAPELVERRPDRYHPDRHDLLLELPRGSVK